MAKKSFNDEKIVEQFITKNDDNTEDQKTNKEEIQPEKKKKEFRAVRENKTRQLEVFERMPMKLEDAKKNGSIETKSKKFQMLMQPSVFEKIKEMAELREMSINEFIHSLLEKAIKDDI